jgi:hypothetical protein
MKRNIFAPAFVLGLFAVQPAHAQVTAEELIDHAIAQAKVAMEATTMTKARSSLRRASNCLIGRDSGYFIVGAGGPCNSRINVTTSTADLTKRELVTNAFNKLLAAGGKASLQDAQDYAEDAIAELEEAQEAE